MPTTKMNSKGVVDVWYKLLRKGTPGRFCACWPMLPSILSIMSVRVITMPVIIGDMKNAWNFMELNGSLSSARMSSCVACRFFRYVATDSMAAAAFLEPFTDDSTTVVMTDLMSFDG